VRKERESFGLLREKEFGENREVRSENSWMKASALLKERQDCSMRNEKLDSEVGASDSCVWVHVVDAGERIKSRCNVNMERES
jgi:hypothetical protein